MIRTETYGEQQSVLRKIGLSRIGIPLLSLFGVGVSSYLLYLRWSGTAAFCAGVGDCEKVQSSPYAEVAGIPVALLGLLMYTALLALSSWQILGSAVAQWPTTLAIFGLSLIGVLYSAYLTYLELFVIESVCIWCVVSAVLITAIFALSLFQMVSTKYSIEEPIEGG